MKIKNCSLLLLLVSILTFSIQIFGAEPATTDEPSAPSSNESNAIPLEVEPLEDENNEPSSEPSEDRFIPSTQISEDLSVSFPVNI